MDPELVLGVPFEIKMTVDDVSVAGRCYLGCRDSMEQVLSGGGDYWALGKLLEHGAATLPDVGSYDNLKWSYGRIGTRDEVTRVEAINGYGVRGHVGSKCCGMTVVESFVI
jgi:hypothetical protein